MARHAGAGTRCVRQYPFLLKPQRGFVGAGLVIGLLMAAVLVGVLGSTALTISRSSSAVQTRNSTSQLAQQTLYALAQQVNITGGMTAAVPAAGSASQAHSSTGGFLVPDGTGGARQDSVGTPFAYCPYDNKNATPAAGFVKGSTSPSGATPVLALIGAGPDRTFQTSCETARTTSAAAAGSDDLVRVMNGQQIVQGTGGTRYFGDPVQEVADLDKITSASSGELRVVKSTGEVYVNTAPTPVARSMALKSSPGVGSGMALSSSAGNWKAVSGGGNAGNTDSGQVSSSIIVDPALMPVCDSRGKFFGLRLFFVTSTVGANWDSSNSNALPHSAYCSPNVRGWVITPLNQPYGENTRNSWSEPGRNTDQTLTVYAGEVMNATIIRTAFNLPRLPVRREISGTVDLVLDGWLKFGDHSAPVLTVSTVDGKTVPARFSDGRASRVISVKIDGPGGYETHSFSLTITIASRPTGVREFYPIENVGAHSDGGFSSLPPRTEFLFPPANFCGGGAALSAPVRAAIANRKYVQPEVLRPGLPTSCNNAVKKSYYILGPWSRLAANHLDYDLGQNRPVKYVEYVPAVYPPVSGSGVVFSQGISEYGDMQASGAGYGLAHGSCAAAAIQLQYWNGSSWVNAGVLTPSGSACHLDVNPTTLTFATPISAQYWRAFSSAGAGSVYITSLRFAGN